MSMRSSTTMTTEEASSGSSDSTASKAAGVAQEHAGAAVDAAKQEAAQVARNAQEHARSVLDSATDELRTKGREQTDRLSSSLGGASQELRRMAEAGEGDSTITGVVRSLADSAERAARRLDEGGPEGVLDELRRMGRQHPMRFLAVAAAGGFMAARLVRSTDTQAVKAQVQGGSGTQGTPEELPSGTISGQVTSTSGLGAAPVGAPATPLPGSVNP